MSRFHVVWLFASFALAFGANHAMKPRVDYALSPGDRTLATGALHADGPFGRHDLRVITLFVVAEDLRRPLSAPLAVRELWLRSPEGSEDEAPDLELFFDFGADAGHPIDVSAHDAALLSDRDLPLLPTAIGGKARSRIRFPGAAAPLFATEGKLRIDEAFELNRDESGATYRIEGKLEVKLRDGDAERTAHATLSARLAW